MTHLKGCGTEKGQSEDRQTCCGAEQGDAAPSRFVWDAEQSQAQTLYLKFELANQGKRDPQQTVFFSTLKSKNNLIAPLRSYNGVSPEKRGY